MQIIFKIIYNIAVLFYVSAIYLASPFNKKASDWVKGRRNLFLKLRKSLQEIEGPRIWMHVSSLGEFEQGRPIIEKIKKNYPGYSVIISFFSPSGFKIRHNYQHAEVVTYLPADLPFLSEKFINLVNPSLAIFVKYEYWYNYLETLHKKNIPAILVSAIFGYRQIFFKWYGKPYLKVLQFFRHIFVQNETSLEILNNYGIKNVIISGDTRFDRVLEIASSPKKIGEIEKIISGMSPANIYVCGSTWPEDEKLICRYINTAQNSLFIIAPHEITSSHIENLKSLIKTPVLIYSELLKSGEIPGMKSDSTVTLIIDTIGLLSSIYNYGDIAYIGGGFGAGIHNILEAAVYGVPVVFGPNYQKFNEAVELIKEGGAFAITSYEELNKIFKKLAENRSMITKAGSIAKNYVLKMAGATEKILQTLTGNNLIQGPKASS